MDKSLMLKMIKDYYHFKTSRDFASFLGMTEQNTYSWFKRGYIDYSLVYKKCPEINPEWLLSDGEIGEMLRDDTNRQTINNGSNNTQVNGNYASVETIEKALDAVAAEQDINKKSQEQIDTLLGIVKKMTDKD